MQNIHILSLCFPAGSLEEDRLFQLAEANLRHGTDMVLFPEACMGDTVHTCEHPFLARMSRLARAHGAYVLCPVFLLREGKRYNSAVLFDRQGNRQCIYEKMYPFWAEYKRVPPVHPGETPCVVDADFGRMAVSICFDANFPGLWAQAADAGAQIVFWVSAYSAGQQLAAHALNHHYAIVTATSYPDCAVFDPDGREVFYACDAGRPVAAYVQVDLDRVLCHYNFNREKVAKLLKEHPEVTVEREHNREQWVLLHSLEPHSCVRRLCEEYGILDLRSYKQKSQRYIDGLRSAGKEETARES